MKMISTVNSRYNQVGYNEITAYNEMEIFPRSTKCINYYPDITKEFTGPKHFVITRVHCIIIRDQFLQSFFLSILQPFTLFCFVNTVILR